MHIFVWMMHNGLAGRIARLSDFKHNHVLAIKVNTFIGSEYTEPLLLLTIVDFAVATYVLSYMHIRM